MSTEADKEEKVKMQENNITWNEAVEILAKVGVGTGKDQHGIPIKVTKDNIQNVPKQNNVPKRGQIGSI